MAISTKKHDLWTITLVCALFILALFICSYFTSPLYPNYIGWDSAIFSLIGKGILEGKQLYLDLFDHKGPMTFLINALGNAIGGREGIFLLQSISGIITLVFLYYSGKLLRSNSSSLPAELGFLLVCVGGVLLYTMEYGNLTEEYSLPVISCAGFFMVKYADRADSTYAHPPVYALVYGLGIGLLSLIRLNNAVTICAGVLAILLYLIYRKQFVNLAWNLLFGSIGIALVLSPVCIYHYMQGSLDEMLYATFLHNFIIAANTGHRSVMETPIRFIVLYAPMLLSAFLLAAKLLHTRKLEFTDYIFFVILGFNILNLWIANRFTHYFTVFIPVYYLFLCRYLRIHWRSVFLWLVLLCMCTNLYYTARRVWGAVNTVHLKNNPRYHTVSEDMRRIPEDERDSVIGYEVMAMDYLAGDIMPCYKYFTLQSTWSITSPHIMTDFLNWVEDNKPLWVLVATESKNEQLNLILDRSYDFRFSNDYIAFYSLSAQ